MGRSRLTPDGADRRAQIVALRNERVPWATIAAQFGISVPRCFQIYAEAIRAAPSRAVSIHRAEVDLMADEAIRSLLGIARDESVTPRSRVEAWHAVRGWTERLGKLHGLDALRMDPAGYLGRADGVPIFTGQDPVDGDE